MNEKILLIHPSYARTGTGTFQSYLLKSLNVNILAKPTENVTRTIWFKLFKEHLFNKKQKIKVYNYYKLRNDFKDYLKNFFNNQKNTVQSDILNFCVN